MKIGAMLGDMSRVESGSRDPRLGCAQAHKNRDLITGSRPCPLDLSQGLDLMGTSLFPSSYTSLDFHGTGND